MTTIRLLDARRGLSLKCRELFRDEKISDAIYRYLCDGIEECEDAEPKRKTGEWITQEFGSWAECSECHELYDIPIANSNFCPNCGSYNGGNTETE